MRVPECNLAGAGAGVGWVEVLFAHADTAQRRRRAIFQRLVVYRPSRIDGAQGAGDALHGSVYRGGVAGRRVQQHDGVRFGELLLPPSVWHSLLCTALPTLPSKSPHSHVLYSASGRARGTAARFPRA